MTILVTGARGHVGALVLSELMAAGEPVRAASRAPQPGQFADGVEVAQLDLDDAAVLPAALAGVHKVFLYAHPRTATQFARAAREAGVEHVVLLSSSSVLRPDATSNPIALAHSVVEEALDDAGLSRTFVRPGYFATNSLRWQSIRSARVFRTAFPEATTAPVHERDIAAVVAKALLDDAPKSAAPAVLGAGPLTVRQQVADIAEAIGEPVRFEVVDAGTYRADLLTQLPAPVVDRLIEGQGTIPQLPADLGVDAVPELIGRPALTFREWSQDHAADFR